tara:strand:- start:349 stop:840 length:492 start_codon:yes stop_codon:yes gene_type:complete
MSNNYKEVEGYKNYLIFDDGRIYSKKTKKFLKTYKVYTTGNHYVSIYDGTRKKKKNMRIANLVANAFLPKPDGIGKEYDYVEHIKSCSDDNVNNLRWTFKYVKDRKSNPTCTLPEKFLHYHELIEKIPKVYNKIMHLPCLEEHFYRSYAVVGMLSFALGLLLA